MRRFPNLVMGTEDVEGVGVSKESPAMYRTSDMFRTTDIFMACGMQEGTMGPPAIEPLAKIWKNGCFYAEFEEVGHLVQEWGAQVARMAIEVFEKEDESEIEGVHRVKTDWLNIP